MSRPFVLHADGGARGNPGPAGIGAVLRDPAGEVVAEVSEAIGRATNNVAEYRSLIAGLEAAVAAEVASLQVWMDSELVVRQMRGEYKTKNPALRDLRDRAREIAQAISEVTYSHVPRDENKEADALVNQALDAAAE